MARQNSASFFEYSNEEWFFIKLSTVLLLCTMLLFFLFFRNDLRFPSGVCYYLDCKYFTDGVAKWVLAILLLFACLLYVFEFFMTITTFMIFGVAILICCMEESTGMRDENGLLSLVFFAQFLAYVLNREGRSIELFKDRIQFPLQFIAAAYFLAGIAKLRISGLAWFIDDAPYFSLEILRKYTSDFVSSGNLELQKMGLAIGCWWSAHPILAQFLLGTGLILELGSFAMLINKRIAFVYAIFLTLMHLGIYLTLHIFYPSIMLPMIIFTINPLYRIFQLGGWIFDKLKRYNLKILRYS